MINLNIKAGGCCACSKPAKREKPVRASGFELPFHWQQVLIWVYSWLILGTGIALLIIQKTLPTIAVLAIIVVYSSFAMIVFILNWTATAV